MDPVHAPTCNALQRFKFTLKNDKDFNYEIVINVFYLGNKPVIYIINESIKFNAITILKNLLAKEIWKILKRYWINVYLKLLNVITHNAGTHFSKSAYVMLQKAYLIIKVECFNVALKLLL
ncbi:hypothetical protein GGTG_05167 [Gaeumannomyces tritici R3-111a-1]|uniref:Integrase catalytic domain-containing protein n=1 Tax=Gaeumannomyces tritici (strain R3-111a-1) TaxID=644352 RepID=J3NV54_GAET3|nr:hypothetical protein GGTG_05167 [Gaeumannomyces tritici R3-111a-1]EJT75230.1 hypothetical protein GGTG_05167 [Gaeumannomyces tritici R3-111a-1]